MNFYLKLTDVVFLFCRSFVRLLPVVMCLWCANCPQSTRVIQTR